MSMNDADGQDQISASDGHRDESADVLAAAAKGQLASRLSHKYLLEYRVLPIDIDRNDMLRVACDPQVDPSVIDELECIFSRKVTRLSRSPDEIESAVLAAQAEMPIDAGADLREGDVEILAPDDEAIDDLQALANQAPVIKLVNLAVLEALRHRASDVHLEATGDGLRIRHRIDGVLHDAALHPRQLQAAAISRIKVMANLNIAERRVPQDGRIALRLSSREVDLRVSTMPTVHGESVVLRILDREAGARELEDLGMDPSLEQHFRNLIAMPNGIVLVAGPTGSGKTTTLYAALQHINVAGSKMVTIEDPVEYQIPGVTQVPVSPKAGRTFASTMRSILRHDPDILMVGEMRDAETAEIAIQAALTGHLVFTTLHTNDAPAGITRLIDMGIEPYLIAATVRGILAQRLVRTVCDRCGVRIRPTAKVTRQATEAGCVPRRRVFRRGKGCENCARTGFHGRTGIYELLEMTEALRNLVTERASLDAIRAEAQGAGMVPLYNAAWAKACAGVTSIEEAIRVTRGASP